MDMNTIVGIVVAAVVIGFIAFKMTRKKDENTTSGTSATGGKPSDNGPVSKN